MYLHVIILFYFVVVLVVKSHMCLYVLCGLVYCTKFSVFTLIVFLSLFFECMVFCFSPFASRFCPNQLTLLASLKSRQLCFKSSVSNCHYCYYDCLRLESSLNQLKSNLYGMMKFSFKISLYGKNLD